MIFLEVWLYSISFKCSVNSNVSPHPQTNLLTANSFCPLSTQRGEGAVLLAIAKKDGG
jgi:hypothetical protein